jgi:putative NADPH-quinone reductase
MSDSKKVLIQFAHPAIHRSNVNKRLIAAAEQVKGVVINDLYQLYPDFYIDVRREQELLMPADLVILHHPLYWYSSPAIMKEWLDVVLEHGFAYGLEATALRDKDFMLAITTGADASAYQPGGQHGFALDDFLKPYVQSATLCGMRYRPPFVVQGCSHVSTQKIDQHAQEYSELLVRYCRDGSTAFDDGAESGSAEKKNEYE